MPVRSTRGGNATNVKEYAVVGGRAIERGDIDSEQQLPDNAANEQYPRWNATAETWEAVTAPTGSGGPAGPTGPRGLQGPPGNDGADGQDGQDGAAGQRGPAGPQGPQGPRGNDGTDGQDGSDGQDGQDGARGPAGPQGPTGPQGPAGPAGSADAQTLEVRASQPTTAGFSVGDIINVSGVLYELIASGALPNVITGIAADYAGGVYRGTHEVQWRTAESGTNPVIVRLPQTQLDAAPGGRPSYILVRMTTPDGFWGEDVLVYDHTRNTIAQGDVPAAYGYDGGSVNWSQAPTGAHFTAYFYLSDAHGAQGAALTVHAAQTRWEIDGRNHAVPTQQSIYPPAKDILQAGGNISITPNDATHTLLIAADVAGGMADFVLGQTPGPTPVASGVIDDDRISPDSRQRMESGYGLDFASTSNTVLFAVASLYSGFRVRNNIFPNLGREVQAWANTALPEVRSRATGAAESYDRVLAFPQGAIRNAAAAQEGVLIDGLPELNAANDRWIFGVVFRANNLGAERPLISVRMRDQAWNLVLKTNGRLAVNIGTAGRETANAATADTWHKAVMSIQRNLQGAYNVSYALGGGSVITIGVDASSLPGLSTATHVAFGQDAHTPTAALTWQGEMCEIFGFYNDSAAAQAHQLPTWSGSAHAARTTPYAGLVTLSERDAADSQFALAAGANLLDAPIALQNSGERAGLTAVFNEPDLDPDTLRGFLCEYRQTTGPYLRFRFFLPIAYLPRRSSGALYTEDNTVATLAIIASGRAWSLTQGWGNATYASNAENIWHFSLFTTARGKIEAFAYWPRHVYNGIDPQLTEIRPVYR